MAGHLRRPADVLLRARAVERRGPDPQGADVRARRRRRQPRRGRQGVLVVRGLHADPLLDALALPLPAGRVPLRPDLVAVNAQRAPRRAGVRAGRHRRLRRGPVLGGHRRLRQGRPDRHVHDGSPSPTAVPTPATLHVLPTLWFRNTWAWGLPGRDAVPRRSPAAAAGWSAEHTAARATLVLDGDGEPGPLVCDNETNAQRLWGLAGPLAVPEGRHQRPRRPRRRHGQPGADAAPRARCTTCSTCRRAVAARSGCGWRTAVPTRRRARRPTLDLGDGFDAVMRRRDGPRPTSSSPS